MTPQVLAIVNHLWQSTLFAGMVWLATLALRSNRARVRYWLWTAASVKFLIPLSVLVSIGEQFEWRTAPAIAQPAMSFVMEEVLLPPIAIDAGSTTSAAAASGLGWLFAGVWFVGFAVVIVRWWRQWRPIRSAILAATPVSLGEGCDPCGLAVMSSPSMFEPGVCGIWRPRLLLPDGLVDRLTPAHLNALIAHERCHVRHHDNLAAAVHMAVEAVFWFHPLVWWIGSRMTDERERACDEAVLRSGNEPVDYAEGLLAVCRYAVEWPVACVAGIAGANLRRRVESIMRRELGRPLNVPARLALGLGAAAVVAGPVVAGALVAPVGAGARVGREPAQTGAKREEFEVASIRPRGPFVGPQVMGVSFLPGGRVRATGAMLNLLIMSAYQISARQIDFAAVEKGLLRETFDIEATAGAHALPPDAPLEARDRQLAMMLRTLLADRFKLAIHSEKRDQPIYALVVAGNGRRLKRSAAELPCESSEQRCGRLPGGPASGLSGVGVEIADLAGTLTLFLDREVVDRTGIQGRFDIDLPSWSRSSPPRSDDGFNGEPQPNPSDPSIFTLVQERLGLRLERTRAARDIYVIDHVEAPTPD